MTYEEAAAAITPGLYRHFKGNNYRVLSIARHSETVQPMVVYRALYGDRGVWVRPAEMWDEVIERDGKTFQRFRKLSMEERVAFFEQTYDVLCEAVHAEKQCKEQKEELQRKRDLLEEYYTSGEWRSDYEADEAGLLPSDLKRGVLSQDGVYDLLTEWNG